MSTYARIKQTVTTRQAAEGYGLSVNRSGMAQCPFHEDHHPSMKVDDRFYCFGCGTSGDVIDFTARLFGLSPCAAAQKLETDFGIGAEPEPLLFPTHAEPSHDGARLCICVLQEYLRHLRIWQLRYRPEKPGDSIHPRFAEAMKAFPTVNHLLDCLLGNDLLLAKQTAEVCRFKESIPKQKKQTRHPRCRHHGSHFHWLQIQIYNERGIFMNVKNEIKSIIVRSGMTMQQVVDLLSDEYGWSDSISNFSNKLSRGSLRYREAIQIADVLGYEIVWQKRRDG